MGWSSPPATYRPGQRPSNICPKSPHFIISKIRGFKALLSCPESGVGIASYPNWQPLKYQEVSGAYSGNRGLLCALPATRDETFEAPPFPSGIDPKAPRVWRVVPAPYEAAAQGEFLSTQPGYSRKPSDVGPVYPQSFAGVEPTSSLI